MRIGSSAIDSVLTGRGESIVTSRAQGSSPFAISNARVALADDGHAAALVLAAAAACRRSGRPCSKPGTFGRHGSVTPIAKTAARQRYSPSVVASTIRPSSSRRVDSQRQP